MKFKIECKSPLLQYSLEKILKDKLDENGILITDDFSKKGIIIGKDIRKPFTKYSLFVDLRRYFENEPSLEEKIEELFDEFKEKLLILLKEYNAKK